MAVTDLIEYSIKYPCYDPLDTSNVEPRQRKLVPQRREIYMHRYSTSMDERKLLTVYEYKINDHTIMWDYHTGYVHITGIWKALGHGKADIVRLLDGSPDLEPLLLRIRGGYLKIQGTWVPYSVARTLATRFCFPIRFALVPIFGTEFPADCLLPHEAGYGQLELQARLHPRRTRPRAQKPETKPRRVSESDVRTQRRRMSSVSRSRRAASLPRRLPGDFLTAKEPMAELVVDETSSSEEDEVAYSPPPMPRKLALRDAEAICESPNELVKMLQATRSLQQLSIGSIWESFDRGGGFELAGRVFHWDGSARLDEL